MDPERWQRIEALYHAALARPVGERAAFVADACGGDEALAQEVASLIEEGPSARGFLSGPATVLVNAAASADASKGEFPPTGAKLGGYRIERPLGRGGMGAVFLAYDTTLHRRVALKLLVGPRESDASRSRLVREARTSAALNHPNICTIHEVGEADGTAFIAMEYVEGRSLRDRLDEGPLGLSDVLRFGIQAADALAYAHDRGVVHRDFKAANAIVTDEGRLKVVDFGLARRDDVWVAGATTMSSLVPAGTAAGTPYAMAPEQVRGEPADARTDIWALGVLLYEMVTGTTPFSGGTVPELFSSILTKAPAPLPDTVPTELQVVIERCLHKEPARRYERADQVRTALMTIQAGTVAPWIAWGYRVRRRPGWATAAAVAALAAVLAGVNAGGVRDRLLGTSPAAAPIRLAVLPFENLTGDPAQEYFSDGLTDEMITQLGRLHPQRLSVIARTSSMRYKNRDVPIAQIGAELGVDYLLEGSARREGSRVRINTTLVDVRAETQRWADTFERELAGILVLQSNIAKGVASALALTLLPAEQARLASVRQVNPEAYEAYLRGMSSLRQYTPEGFKQAVVSLERAIELDPSEPLSHAGLALTYGMASHGPAGSIEAGERTKNAALRALELDNNLAEVHEALALIRIYHDYDVAGAEQSFRRALDLNPNLAAAHAHYAWLHWVLGRHDDAVREARRATEIDPFEVLWLAFEAWMYHWLGRYDDALAVTDRALQLNPSHPVALYVLGNTYVSRGQYDAAIIAHQKAWNVTPEWGWGLGHAYALAGRPDDARRIAAELAARPTAWRTWGLAEIYAALGEGDEAFRWLNAAYEQRHGYFPSIGYNPFFTSLRDDPRFETLLRRLNLPRPPPTS
jgi:TolB-like protein/Tfp pilus assembly protein PilF/predicted Ser/Thr protein kinase